MKCPNQNFLHAFACDPDLALESNPDFNLHLATCSHCQSALDAIGKAQRSVEIAEFFADESPKDESFPHVAGYTISEFIAAGTSGAVYKAQQDRTGRLVALKLVYSLTGEQRQRINTERRALINCDHPNIVQLLDCGPLQGGGYLATRWVTTSLAQFVRDSPIVDLQSAVDWSIQIAGAISHLHGLGIIHRDLKLSNVLLTSDGIAKLTDFGIAKELTTNSTLTAPQTPMGTPGYMAPEQTGQSADQVSFATDIYGLGAVLYHLITGRQPFIGSEAMQVISQVMHDAPIPPRKLRPEIPKELETICLKCLQKCATDRYASSLELAEDLSRFRAGDPIHAKPMSDLTLLMRSIRKHQTSSVLIALLLATIFTGTAYILQSRRQHLQQHEQMSRLALLDAIAGASADRLPALFAEATVKIGESLPASSFQNSNAAERLRWLCIAPHSNQVEIQPKELIDVIQDVASQELELLLPKLVEIKRIQNDEFRSALDNAIVECKRVHATIRLVSFRSALDPHWRPSQDCLNQVLTALTETPVDESLQWARLLQPVKGLLVSALVAREDKVELLGSSSLRITSWQWLNQDVTHVAEFIQSIPIASIAEIRQLSPQIRPETLKILRAEYQNILRKIDPEVNTKPISAKLQDLLDRGSGYMWASRGIVRSLNRELIEDFIAELAENQLSLLSVQPYTMEDQELFCAVFESSTDPCEVDWDLPLSNFQSAITDRRNSNWEAVYAWVGVNSTPQNATVLWRKGDWGPSSFHSGEIPSAINSIAAEDSDQTKSQILSQSFRKGDETYEFALQTTKDCEPTHAPNHRHLYLNSGMLVDGFALRTTHKLEFNIGEEEIIGIPQAVPQEHQRQEKLLAQMGYQPFYLLAESQTGNLGSYWHRKKLSHRVEHEGLAKSALASWVLGDSQLVLDALNSNDHPAVRTAIVENLSTMELDSIRIANYLQPDLSANQLQGLLISLANASKSPIEDRQLLWDKLMWCWAHPDSGVHFASDHLLRQHFPTRAAPIVHDEYRKNFGYDPSNRERNWFYGAFGLPFVIVNPETSSVIGIDEHLPWNLTIDRHLERVNRRFAICAVEIPQFLVEKFLIEMEPTETPHDFLNPPNGPAMGLSLELMLKFCSWLSDKEGIPREQVGLPDFSDIKNGLRLTEDFWDKNGYRLPTNVEWETAFRCGTTSRHFLGDSYEYLQNYCWDSTNCEQSPNPIATRKPNPWGLFDIAGNLYEAVLGDTLNYSTIKSVIWGEKSLDKDTVLDIRGGSFISSRIYSSAGSHHHIGAWSRDINCGFRIVRTLPNTAE